MYSKFATLLSEKSITAAQVSKETGVPNSTLSDWKHGKSIPKANKLKILADYFGVSIDYFLN